MIPPAQLSESDALTATLTACLDGLRHAAYGLTEEQARQTPCRSALSIGGLLKHATFVMGGLDRIEELRARDWQWTDAMFAEFYASFALTEEETLDGVLARFDAARGHYLAQVAALDPAGAFQTPPAPWFDVHEPSDAVWRWQLLHTVRELAQHAGHADIIREQVDGAQAVPLMLAATGTPGNDFVQPWEPEEAVSGSA